MASGIPPGVISLLTVQTQILRLSGLKYFPLSVESAIDVNRSSLRPILSMPPHSGARPIELTSYWRNSAMDESGFVARVSCKRLAPTRYENSNFMREPGSDLPTHAFACNFHRHGRLNTDVVVANFLNRRVAKRLSVPSTADPTNEIPAIILSSRFFQGEYGEALARVWASKEMKHVSALVWGAETGYLSSMTEWFRSIIGEVIKTCLL
ncbi:hypothetical protein E1B28_009378 [Marasmius oreades]|uniref:Uncharacterized protein n=1 Tax=Marasmius oreades TaxID=181124 RepID=A0A9P7UU94_9AGAR|nr:uncharacterized protein E1B28_009378 [Marasmius oreades]KAG7093091.1 hypothetical protein E1B28_009378 [Marasmius oreades]